MERLIPQNDVLALVHSDERGLGADFDVGWGLDLRPRLVVDRESVMSFMAC